jgi:hypothetical protein
MMPAIERTIRSIESVAFNLKGLMAEEKTQNSITFAQTQEAVLWCDNDGINLDLRSDCDLDEQRHEKRQRGASLGHPAFDQGTIDSCTWVAKDGNLQMPWCFVPNSAEY